MSPITIVLRSGMGMHIDSVRPYLRNGMPIAIGRAGAVISHFADGDAHLALHTIAEFPCPEQDNMPAANMRQIALAALGGAGASSEPGNPGRESVSGPGNAGERPYPAPGLVGDHTELRRIAIALKNPQLSGEEASDLMVRYEALTMPDHIIALIDRKAQHYVPEAFRKAVEWADHLLFECGALGKTRAPSVRVYNKAFAAVEAAKALLAAAPAPGGER
ncbi:TPA: hypothetical protein RQ695_004685 [Pseudomonas aeruginosa]|nr:hypothetical protein [Pseudomonas aeruginosa]HDY6351841.1 hypothetical protein [Pseudomonas aeruginosa]